MHVDAGRHRIRFGAGQFQQRLDWVSGCFGDARTNVLTRPPFPPSFSQQTHPSLIIAMGSNYTFVMADSLGDQGFMPDVLKQLPDKAIEYVIGFALQRPQAGAASLPVKFSDPEASATVSRFMKGLKEAEQYILEQQNMAPEKVAPMTKERLSFLDGCRRRFEADSGKDQRFRHTYFSTRTESSKVRLEDLKESALHFGYFVRVYTDTVCSFNLSAACAQNTQGSPNLRVWLCQTYILLLGLLPSLSHSV